jgi:hypothetical protein
MITRQATHNDLHRRGTSPSRRNSATRPEDRDQTLDGSPDTHAAAGQAKKDVERKWGAPLPALLEATSPALHASVESGCDTGVRVETLTRQEGGLLDLVGQDEHAGEAVGEVDHEDGADETDDAADVWHGCCNDECENPVDGTQAVPGDLALGGGDGREVEDLLEDLEVDGLHADVEVHDCNDC